MIWRAWSSSTPAAWPPWFSPCRAPGLPGGGLLLAVPGLAVAALLLAHGERVIAERYPRAYLVVLEANARARRFYAKHGWIDTLEGGHIVCPGDWIITGVKGEHYPCKPDIFEMTYEPVE